MTEKKEDFRHSKKFSRFLHDEEMRLKNSVIKIFGVFFLILIGINSYQILRLTKAFETVKDYNQGVVDEVGQMKRGLVDFGNDLNEIRSYLYLPTREYFVEEEVEAETDEDAQESTEASQALYKLLTDVADEKKREEAFAQHCQFIKSLQSNANFATQMAEQQLTVNELSEEDEACSFKLSKDEIAAYNLVASKTNKEGLLIQSAVGEQQITLSEDTEQKIVDYLKNNTKKVLDLKQRLEDQKLALMGLIGKEEVVTALTQNRLKMESAPTETAEVVSYLIKDSGDTAVSEVQIDRKTGDYKLEGQIYKDTSLLEPAFVKHLNELEGVSTGQKSIEKQRDELEAIFKEKAFESLLKQNDFTITHAPREEGNRLIYDIKNVNDEVVMSIVLDVGLAEYRLLRQGDQEIDLLSILQPTGEEKKNLALPEVLPEFGASPKSAEGLTILVAGKHGSLVDTMMVVHLAKGKISIVSVPRDLYWNGRKINSVYAFYGMEELLRVLSQISGYQIDHYALIDMYAFIDVVNLIGCLDVTLEKDLIDPTYKTEDNGVWGTLYYAAGTHHLCGKQALRVARSRHTSSDFSRAERQHLILEAIKNKAKEIGLKDAGKLKELAETTLKYVESDLNAAQMMAYYFRFKEFEMNRGYVLTSGNVLESTFTGDLNGSGQSCTTNEAGEQVCTAANRGAYILLPRGGNWNNIKWYFQQAFEKEGEGIK